MDDTTVDEYEKQLMHLESRLEIMPQGEWPDLVTGLMRYYHGDRLPPLTREQVYEIDQRLRKPGRMMRDNLPILCMAAGTGKKDGCPYVPGCPLEAASIAPVGKICPFESRMIDEMFNEYLSSLHVDGGNMVEMGQIKDLVTIDLLMHRITGSLSRSGITDRNPVGVTAMRGYPDGHTEEEVLYRVDPAAEALLLDKLYLRKQTILRNMMATREMKMRYQSQEREDAATLIARLKALRTKQKNG